MTSSRPIWMKTILIGFLGGLALTIGEVFGNSFWREQYLFNPDDWQIFLTGAVVPSLIFLALSFISRRVKLKDN
jgi:hypothetical protein